MAAFGNHEIAMTSLTDPLVLFNSPTLGFMNDVLASTDFISASLSNISVPFLVSTD